MASPVALVMLQLPVSHDSAVILAKFAMNAIEGSLQLPKIRPSHTMVSKHYQRHRRGGGETQVAVMAAIIRDDTEPSAGFTNLELSAWMLDIAHRLTAAERRAGVPVTAITTNAPALSRPRAITPADTTDWLSLQIVLDALVKQGARRLP